MRVSKVSGHTGSRFCFLFFFVPMSRYTAVGLLSGCQSSRDLSLAEKRSRFPSSRIFADEIPPSFCIAAVGVIIKTKRAGRSPARKILSIISLRAIESCRTTVSFVVRCLRPGHQTSDPYIATEVTTLSMTPT